MKLSLRLELSLDAEDYYKGAYDALILEDLRKEICGKLDMFGSSQEDLGYMLQNYGSY